MEEIFTGHTGAHASFKAVDDTTVPREIDGYGLLRHLPFSARSRYFHMYDTIVECD